MTTAALAAQATADRVIDEDEVIAAARETDVSGVVGAVLDGLHDAAASDGVTDEQARGWAREQAADVMRAVFAGEVGRRLGAAGMRVVRRTRQVTGHGLSAAQARGLERVTTQAVQARLAKRGSPRAEDAPEADRGEDDTADGPPQRREGSGA